MMKSLRKKQHIFCKCITNSVNEAEDKVICFNGARLPEKLVERPVRELKKEKKTRNVIEILIYFYNF